MADLDSFTVSGERRAPSHVSLDVIFRCNGANTAQCGLEMRRRGDPRLASDDLLPLMWKICSRSGKSQEVSHMRMRVICQYQSNGAPAVCGCSDDRAYHSREKMTNL